MKPPVLVSPIISPKALGQKGIHNFKDDKLQRGEVIGSQLLKTIEESRVSMIIFKKNHAQSKWCLDEVTKIMECMKERRQIVLPAFYHVDPSDVRKQTGSFRISFGNCEEDVGEKEKVRRWRGALTKAGRLSGWHVQDG